MKALFTFLLFFAAGPAMASGNSPCIYASGGTVRCFPPNGYRFPDNTTQTTAATGTSVGGSIGSATAGSVLFINPANTLAQDNANFFWDATNFRLGIGTTTPGAALETKSGLSYIRLEPSTSTLTIFASGLLNAVFTPVYYGGSFGAGLTLNSNFRAGAISTSSGFMSGIFDDLGAGTVNLWSATGQPNYISFNETGVADNGVIGFSAGSADLVYKSGTETIAGGTELFRVKSNGNFGIGTNSPGTKLDVTGNVNITDAGATGGNVPHARTRRSSTTATSATCAVTCSAGETVTGGGCQNSLGLNLTNSYPSADATWTCAYTLATGSCTAWAVCFQY